MKLTGTSVDEHVFFEIELKLLRLCLHVMRSGTVFCVDQRCVSTQSPTNNHFNHMRKTKEKLEA